VDNCDHGSSFAQATFDGSIGFPTFGTQRLDVDAHVVASAGRTPFSRLAYVGGSGSLPTVDQLSLGGDELAVVSFRYSIPLERVQLPLIGPPMLSLREILAGAGSSGVPTMHQAMGVRLSAGFVYGELLIDPASRHSRLSFGLSSGR
jgi:hypothetical protein